MCSRTLSVPGIYVDASSIDPLDILGVDGNSYCIEQNIGCVTCEKHYQLSAQLL